MNTNWRVALVNQAGEIRMPVVPMRSPFFMTWATVNVVVGSTGDKTITTKVLGQTCTFTTTFATTGSYTLAFGVVIRNVGNTRSVIVFPPTYITKSAGTTPTNGILPSTQSVVVTVDIGGGIGIYVLPGPPIHGGATPGCLNWLVATARDANTGPGAGNYILVDPFVGPTAAIELKNTRDADAALTTNPASLITWSSPSVGTPVPETTFYNPSGDIIVDGSLGVVAYGSGIMYRIIRTGPSQDVTQFVFPDRTPVEPGREGVTLPSELDIPHREGVTPIGPNLTDQLANATTNGTMPVGNSLAGNGPQDLTNGTMLGD